MSDILIRSVDVDADKIIFSPKSVIKYTYIVQSGKVELFKKLEDGTKEVAEIISAGQLFGLEALLNLGARKFTARTLEKSSFIIIDQACFEKRIKAADPFITALIDVLKNNMKSILNIKSQSATLSNSVEQLAKADDDYIE